MDHASTTPLGNAHACSSSINVPQKSFGCRNRTGLPCAPIVGSPRRARARRSPSAGRGRPECRRLRSRRDGCRRRDCSRGISRSETDRRADAAARSSCFRQLDKDRRHAVLGQRHRRRDFRAERVTIESAPRHPDRERRWQRDSGFRSFRGCRPAVSRNADQLIRGHAWRGLSRPRSPAASIAAMRRCTSGSSFSDRSADSAISLQSHSRA